MATFKCKMCDAVLNVREGTSIYVCEYCGTKQTVPMDWNSGSGHNEKHESASADPLLKRAFMFLEDGKWEQAKQYCERVLDRDPENARAYLCKLMAEINVHSESELSDLCMDYRNNDNYIKVLRFGDPQMVNNLKACSVESAYKMALKLMNNADYHQAANQFRSVAGYKYANERAVECEKLAKEEADREKAKQIRILKENKYNKIYGIILSVPIFFILFAISTITKDISSEKKMLAIFIMSAVDVLCVAASRYMYHFINKNKSYFWIVNIAYIFFSNLFIFIELIFINYKNPGELQVGALFWKPLIALTVCSIIGGFLGDRLGKWRAKKSKK